MKHKVGHAYPAREVNGPQGEILVWKIIDNDTMAVTWAMRGVDGYKEDEGPKPSGAGFVLRWKEPGSHGDGRWTGHREDSYGRLVETDVLVRPVESGQYVARDERGNSTRQMAAVFAAEADARDEVPPRLGRPPIGRQINFAIGDDLLGRVDVAAKAAGMNRSAWLRWAAEKVLTDTDDES